MSSNSETIISIKDLGKCYTLYNRPQDRLKSMLFGRYGRRYGRPFWALRHISFDVQKGETFGVIGKNGSGKSTLLQMLAGTLDPSSGTMDIHGRISALLELGAGFNPEFTGRENVYLYGSILGISREEMRDRFDEIMSFADIGDFIDQPVKIYSSGMFVRLAFAVTAGIDAEIILIDEALAVGDIFFRQKCYRRLEKLRQKGTTILLVSHGMAEVEQFCERAALLKEGNLEYLGSAKEAVKRYYLIDQMDRQSLIASRFSTQGVTPSKIRTNQNAFWPEPDTFVDVTNRNEITNGWGRFTAFAICNQAGEKCATFAQGEKACFFYEVEVLEDIEVPVGGIEFVNEKGTIVHGKNTLQYELIPPFYISKGTRLHFRQDFDLELAVGEYSFNLGFSTILKPDFSNRDQLSHPDLDSKIIVICNVVNAGYFAIIFRKNARPTQLLHHGIANLPGSAEILEANA